MKKMIVTIIILLIIFISMVIYRNSEKQSEINIDEINEIESYLEKIYGWKEITNEALPNFDNINNVDEKWIWGTVRENIDDYEVEYEKIQNTAKELYGKNFDIKYPKEGTEFITCDEVTGEYQVQEITLDAIKDSFFLNKIDRNNNGYDVEIIEYLIDYTNSDEGRIIIKNLNDEIIYQLTEDEATEGNIQKIIKENFDKFTKKRVTLEKEDEKLVVKKVEKVE